MWLFAGKKYDLAGGKFRSLAGFLGVFWGLVWLFYGFANIFRVGIACFQKSGVLKMFLL